MAFPAPADFTTGTELSAWFVTRRPGQASRVCQSSGYDVLFTLLSTMRERFFDAPTLQAWDGPVTADQLPADAADGWNRNVLRALFAFGQRDGAPGKYLQAARNDAAGSQLSADTMALAIWVAELNRGLRGDDFVYGVGTPAEVSFRDPTVFPSLGMPLPTPPSGGRAGFLCRVATTEELSPVTLGGGGQQPFSPWLAIGLLGAAALGAGALTRNLRARDGRR